LYLRIYVKSRFALYFVNASDSISSVHSYFLKFTLSYWKSLASVLEQGSHRVECLGKEVISLGVWAFVICCNISELSWKCKMIGLLPFVGGTSIKTLCCLPLSLSIVCLLSVARNSDLLNTKVFWKGQHNSTLVFPFCQFKIPITLWENTWLLVKLIMLWQPLREWFDM
jgi:hypothetical protein